MTHTYATLRNRLAEVADETMIIVEQETRAGLVKSDRVVDKVQHLVNVAKKFADVADAEASAPASWSDREAMTSSSVDVLNIVNLPIHAPTQEVSVDVRPDMHFVQLKCGKVNLQHVAFLDTETKKMHLVGGVGRKLDDADFQKLTWWTDRYLVR